MRPAALLALLLLTPSAVFAEAPLKVKGVGATEELSCAAARQKLPENAMRTKMVGIVSMYQGQLDMIEELEDMKEEAEKNKSASKESFVCSIDYLLP